MVRLMNRTIFFSIMLSLSTSFIFAETETELKILPFINTYTTYQWRGTNPS